MNFNNLKFGKKILAQAAKFKKDEKIKKKR